MTASAEPGLLARLQEASERAMAQGAIQPIATRCERVADGNAEFALRVVDALRRKQRAQEPHGPGHDPFLPHDPRLFVADLGPRHLVLLNKFNVLDRHALIVTRAFADQEMALDVEDFEMLWQALGEVDGLGFYNAGTVAGSSQRHKHLQLAPFPLAPGFAGVPLQPMFDEALEATQPGEAQRIIFWRFRHALCRVAHERLLLDAGRTLERQYHALLRAVGLSIGHDGRCVGYNLLLTRDWMLVVRRAREDWRGLSINALAFAGCLLARTEPEAAAMRAYGPLNVLAAVCETE